MPPRSNANLIGFTEPDGFDGTESLSVGSAIRSSENATDET